jgi:hypothetical protein
LKNPNDLKIRQKDLERLTDYCLDELIKISESDKKITLSKDGKRVCNLSEPVYIDCRDEVIAGQGRLIVACKLGFDLIRVIVIHEPDFGYCRRYLMSDRIAERELGKPPEVPIGRPKLKIKLNKI